VLIHELGHLWAANWAGIPVAGFSVGFGPNLMTYFNLRDAMHLLA
jgi:membrane-associated protease RseP (regulator of RpoE activity)